MKYRQKHKYLTLIISLIIVFVIFSIKSIGNPIPIYPNYETYNIGIENKSNIDIIWFTFVFFIDFSLNILIIYPNNT